MMKGSRIAVIAASAALSCCLLLATLTPAPRPAEVELEGGYNRPVSSQAQHAVMKALAPTAKILANSMLFTAVAQHARSNPKSPGRAAMRAVLDDREARKKIAADVENKLANDHSGEYAVEIRNEVPEKYQSLIPELARTAAVSATTMAFIDLRDNVLKADDYPESMDRGYLENGNSLADMPILMGSSARGQYGPVAKDKLEFHCKSECESHHLCVAYTYKPSMGACYLKSKLNPVRGTDCTKDCWFFGVVHQRLP